MLLDGPPRVLAMQLVDGLGLARSARLLGEAGFRVGALARPGSLIHSSNFVSRRFPLVGEGAVDWLRCLTAAFAEWRFHLVVPLDGRTAALLRSCLRLIRNGRATGLPDGFRSALESSLGDPVASGPLDSRTDFAEAARSAGLTAPPSSRIVVVSDALRFAEEHGYPVEVQAEGPVGAAPRYRCRTEQELSEVALAALRRPSASRAPLWVSARPQGRRLGCAAVAILGKVSGMAVYEKAALHPADGARATVVVACDSSPLVDAALALLDRLGFTGLAEVDVVLDPKGPLWLVGFAPCFVPELDACRVLGFHAGRLLRCAMEGSKPEPWTWAVGESVALDPEEALRDPESPWLGASRKVGLGDDPGLEHAVRERIHKGGQLGS